MRFPFILRSDHLKVVALLNILVQAKDQTIIELSKRIADKDAEIKALTPKRLEPSVVTTANKPEKVRKVAEVQASGRGGWRHKAQQASLRTLPKASDSIQALEERVRKSGGKVDAL